MTSGPESEDLDREVEALADAAESDSETMANLKGLAVQLWANFDAYSVEELEDRLRDAWRSRGLPFNDNAEL
jgi:hypothetical protein